MRSETDAFLRRFCRFGSAPGAETYLPLFDPEATLFDAGMAAPIRVPEIQGHIEAILRLVPDFRMTPERWREGGGTVFVEAHNAATLGGAPTEWRSVYCVDLRGEHVIRGRRYYDRRPVFARLAPDLPALPGSGFDEVEPRSEDVELALERLVAGAKREVLAQAGDVELGFVEWRTDGTVGGDPFSVGGVDRFDGSGGRAYFDTLALAARLAEVTG